MTTLGAHSASLLGAHGSARRRGGSPLSAAIGGESVLTRERSPFRAASAVVGSVASGQRDVRIPHEPGRGQSR